MKKHPTILILGTRGMLGHTLFSYFSSVYPKTTWGTQRKKSSNPYLLPLSVEGYETDFKKIFRRVKKVDYVINAIVINQKDAAIQDIIRANSIFPHQLETLGKKYGFKLIHVSTDAVFSERAGKVNENTPISPTTFYGASKLLGETSEPNAITIRTSLIGRSPYKKEGLLERTTGQKTVTASPNQRWAGATTLQFTTFCNYLCNEKVFKKLRIKSTVFHFAPLGPTNKYHLLKTYLSLIHSSCKVQKTTLPKMTRQLATLYSQLLLNKYYLNNIEKALEELLLFEDKAAN